MAFRDQANPIGDFVNVTFAVGRNAPNYRTDVMLVQYLLLKHYNSPGSQTRPAGNMVVDGYHGPITQKWINQYQRELLAPDVPTAQDGRVDRAYGMMGSISKTIYVIIQMNASFKHRYPPGHLDTDPECPPLLKAELGPRPVVQM